jgi:glycosyltransferase involved in cell wall biosynthesis
VLDKLIPRADALTVVATFLQRRYGGVLLRHGPDTAVFDPARHDGAALRRKWGLPAQPRLILFAGPSRPWKGLDQILAALTRIPAHDVRVLMAGPRAGALPDRVIHVGLQSHAVMPELLGMADLVVLPQRPHPMTVAQVPNKGLEAMAMAKPIVASRVGDLPDVLEGCGVVVEPENTAELAGAIEQLLADPEGAREMGRRARERCVREFSHDAIARVLAGVLRQFAPDALTPPGPADTRE